MQNTQDAYVMEFCLPFFAVSRVILIGLLGADLVTVLRNPVDRVWSMSTGFKLDYWMNMLPKCRALSVAGIGDRYVVTYYVLLSIVMLIVQ
jgi:hypothetical protein